jgi:hypothetical protein
MSKEWITYGKNFRDFKNEKLNEPGVQVETESGNTYLLGEVNMMGGCCDDCPDLCSNDIIVRYRRLLSVEELESP